MDFRIELDLNEYLPEGKDTVDAVVTVTAAESDGDESARAALVSEVLVIDASGSMQGAKFRQAVEGARVALKGMRPGTRFAIVRGTDTAELVYPTDGTLASADRISTGDAIMAVRRMRCRGGTAIGTWLTIATELLRDADGVRHVTLLTDGRDEGETPEELLTAIDGARGVFQCDCRGVGTDWSPDQLRSIADALLGTVDIVVDPEDLATDFARITTRLMGLSASDVVLRVWTPRGARVDYFKQVYPDVVDLTSPDGATEPSTTDYATGAWRSESRGFQLRVALTPGAVGQEILAARVSLMVDGAVADRVLVRAIWTDDLELSTRVSQLVGHYTGMTQMSSAIQQGLKARREGDDAIAQRELGVATALAAAAGAQDTLELLAKVVTIEDATTGRVRLLPHATVADEMTLDTRSTRTTPVRRIQPPVE